MAAQLAIDWDAPRRNRREAREALTPEGLREDHRRILEALRAGPLTDDQIREATGVHPNAVRARRGELVTRGQVVPVDSVVGPSGRKVTRWGIAP